MESWQNGLLWAHSEIHPIRVRSLAERYKDLLLKTVLRPAFLTSLWTAADGLFIRFDALARYDLLASLLFTFARLHADVVLTLADFSRIILRAGLLLLAALLAVVRLLSPYRAGDAAQTQQDEYDCSHGSHDDLLSARCDITSGHKLSPVTQERLSKQRWYQVAKK